MKIYLTRKSIPELSGLSWADSDRIWSATYLRVFRHWLGYIGFLVGGLGAGAGVWIGSLLFQAGSVGVLVLCGLGALLGGLVGYQLHVVCLRPHFAEARSQLERNEL